MNERLRRGWLFVHGALKEPSTWRGIVMLTTGFSAANEPERADAYVTFGLIVVGFIGVVARDKK